MTVEHLAKVIAKARHDTDVMWANYMGAASEAVMALSKAAGDDLEWEAKSWLEDIIITQTDGAQ